LKIIQDEIEIGKEEGLGYGKTRTNAKEK